MNYLSTMFRTNQSQIEKENIELIKFFKDNANNNNVIILKKIINKNRDDEVYFLHFIQEIITTSINDKKLYLLNKKNIDRIPHYSLILQTHKSISSYKDLYDDIVLGFIKLLKTSNDDYILIDFNIMLNNTPDIDYKDTETYYMPDLYNIIVLLGKAYRQKYEFRLINHGLKHQIDKIKKILNRDNDDDDNTQIKNDTELSRLLSSTLANVDDNIQIKNDAELSRLLLANLDNKKIYLYNILLSLKQFIDNDTNNIIGNIFPYNDIETLKSYYICYLEAIINYFIKINKLYILQVDTKQFFLKQIIEKSQNIYENIYNGDYYLFKTKNGEYILIKKSDIKKTDFDIIIKNLNHLNSNSITFEFNNLNFADIIITNKLLHTILSIGGYNENDYMKLYNIFDYINRIYQMLHTYNPNMDIVTGGNIDIFQIHTNKKNNAAYINYNNIKSYFYKDNNKIFIKINNKIVYLNKKILSYDKNLNNYFIKI